MRGWHAQPDVEHTHSHSSPIGVVFAVFLGLSALHDAITDTRDRTPLETLFVAAVSRSGDSRTEDGAEQVHACDWPVGGNHSMDERCNAGYCGAGPAPRTHDVH